jgi:hypothetical protein
MREAIVELLEESFYASLKGKDQKEQVEKEVADGKIPPLNGALKLFKIFKAGS